MTQIVQGAKSFSRSIKILQLISDQEKPTSVAHLLKVGDLTRPTLYRILSALEAEGLISQNSDKSYQLGNRIISLAHRALAQNDVRKIARPALELLRDEVGETVHLAIKNQLEMVYVDKIESKEMVRMASTIGTRVPFHSSSVGKAFLAAMPNAEANSLIDALELGATTQQSLTDKQVLKTYLIQAKQQGFSFESEENELGIICYGAAILNPQQQPVASVSISIPMFRLKSDHKIYTKALQKACSNISYLLGNV